MLRQAPLLSTGRSHCVTSLLPGKFLEVEVGYLVPRAKRGYNQGHIMDVLWDVAVIINFLVVGQREAFAGVDCSGCHSVYSER